MDGKRFDEIVRGLAEESTRRDTLRRAGAATAALALGLLGRRQRSEAAACRAFGEICREDGHCCSNLCGPKDNRNRRTCICEANSLPCNGTCCKFPDLCTDGVCGTPVQPTSAKTAWDALSASDALTTIGLADGFVPAIGAQFQLRVPARGTLDGVVDVTIVEVEAPRRVVVDWRTATMARPATAEITLRETDRGTHLVVNRIAGDPATCRLATALFGQHWRQTLFDEALVKHLARTTRT